MTPDALTARRVRHSVEACLICQPNCCKDILIPRHFSNNSFPLFFPSPFTFLRCPTRSCHEEGGRGGEGGEGAETRRKQEERTRKEAKEAETAVILAMRQAAKELVEKSRSREKSPPLAS